MEKSTLESDTTMDGPNVLQEKNFGEEMICPNLSVGCFHKR